jgi:hypothetical protein
VAHAARHEPNEDLAGLRLGEVELLDLQWSTEFLEDGGADLHGSILSHRGLELMRRVWYPWCSQRGGGNKPP